MDKKPIDPQLKQIYDRIMTTPTKQPATPLGGTQSTPGVQIPGSMNSTPSPAPMPVVSQPNMPPAPDGSTRIFPSLSQSSITQAPAPMSAPPTQIPTPTAMNTPQQSATTYSSSNSSFTPGGSYIPPVNIPPPMPMPTAPESLPSMPPIQPRAIKNASQPLIFSSKNKSHNTITMGGTGATGEQIAEHKSANVLAIFIGLLVVVFLLAYSVFWLIFFGIIVI